jgi:hypothetical protein
LREQRVALATDPAHRDSRANARTKQRLVRIDVPDADDHPRIHQHLLDGHSAFARGAMQEGPIEFVVERLDAEVFDEPVFAPVALVEVNASKPARVRET